MSIPKDHKLYEKAKDEADKIYKKSSAYKSGYIVKTYKKLYKEKYGDENAFEGKKKKQEGLTRWFNEKWTDVGSKKNDYPLYRPTVRVNKKTPKTAQEVGKKRLEEQDILKQIYKGMKNLPKF
jgi:hypothetical protein